MYMCIYIYMHIYIYIYNLLEPGDDLFAGALWVPTIWIARSLPRVDKCQVAVRHMLLVEPLRCDNKQISKSSGLLATQSFGAGTSRSVFSSCSVSVCEVVHNIDILLFRRKCVAGDETAHGCIARSG